MEKKELDLDTFGEIIDKFLTEVEGMMLIKMPKGTQEVEVEDNLGAGSVVQFYFLLQALEIVSGNMCKDMGLDRTGPEWAAVLDQILGTVREDLTEEKQEA